MGCAFSTKRKQKTKCSRSAPTTYPFSVSFHCVFCFSASIFSPTMFLSSPYLLFSSFSIACIVTSFLFTSHFLFILYLCLLLFFSLPCSILSSSLLRLHCSFRDWQPHFLQLSFSSSFPFSISIHCFSLPCPPSSASLILSSPFIICIVTPFLFVFHFVRYFIHFPPHIKFFFHGLFFPIYSPHSLSIFSLPSILVFLSIQSSSIFTLPPIPSPYLSFLPSSKCLLSPYILPIHSHY